MARQQQALHGTFSVVDILDRKSRDMSLRKAKRTEFRLMKSLAELLNDKPFRDIRNSDISANAGVSYGVLHARFDNKKILALKLADFFREQLVEHFLDGRDEPEDPYVRLLDQIHYFLLCVENNRGMWRLMVEKNSEDFQIEDVWKRGNRFWTDRTMTMLPGKVMGRKPGKAEVELLTVAISGLLDGVFTGIVEQGPSRKLSRAQVAEWLAILRFRALMGRDPPEESVKRGRQLLRQAG